MKDIENILLKLYELNERYHDTKEKMAWLGSSLYFAFSLAILRILFIKEMQNFIKQDPWVIIGFLLAICVFALLFINFQFKKKRNSVVYTGELEKQLCSLQSKGEEYSESEDKLLQLFKRKDEIFQDKMEVPDIYIYILMGIFFASQITLIILIRYKFKY